MRQHQVRVQNSLHVRQNRKGIDLVKDCVHDQLLKETSVFNGVQALLTRTIEQGEEQLR